MGTRNLRLNLIGYHASRNFGDLLMLDAFTMAARRRGFTVVHSVPELDEYCEDWARFLRPYYCRYGSRNSFQRALYWWRKGGNSVNRIVLVGGTHIQEYSSGRSGISGLKGRIERLAADRLAVDLVGIGINPVKEPINRKQAAELLSMADWVSLRDAPALDHGRELLDRAYVAGADLAFSSDRFRQADALKLKGSVLICPVDRSTTDGNAESVDRWAHVVHNLRTRGNRVLLFLCEEESDRRLREELGPLCHAVHQSRGKLDEDIVFLASAECALIQRYHGLLCCGLLDIPALACSYNPKVLHLAGQLGLPESYVVADELELLNLVLPFGTHPYSRVEECREAAHTALKAYFDHLDSLSGTTALQ